MTGKRPFKIFCCPDCRKRFEKVSDLNKHITHTGCNGGRHLVLLLDFARRNPVVAYKDTIRTQ